jgi:hypothetical protein
MSLELHRKAESLMAAGDRHTSRGEFALAASAYAEAGRQEAEAFELIPVDRIKTRGMIAISALGLLRKGSMIEEAIRLAHYYLSLHDLPQFATVNIEALLDEMRTLLARRNAGWTPAPDHFEWVLNGPSVGHGSARLAVASSTMDHIGRFGARVVEFIRDEPVRTRGQVSAAIQKLFDMTVTQPTAGSFTFGIRFSVPTEQLPMFPDTEPLEPSVVGATFSEIIDAIQAEGPEALESRVPSAGYRDAFLRILRALAPDGKNVRRVEIRHHWADGDSNVTVLSSTTRRVITGRLAVNRPVAGPTRTIEGVLREVDLDKNSIQVSVLGQSSRQRCQIGEGIVLVDVAEALLDQRVRLTGRFRANVFIVSDVEEADGEELPPSGG